MKAIILAGGYARRLQSLNSNLPKPLLPVQGKPIIEYVLEKIDELGSYVSETIILTNHTFKDDFARLANGRNRANLRIFDDGATREENKAGAVGALGKIVESIGDDFLILAGDCLFRDRLAGLVQLFAEVKAPVVGLYRPRNEEQMVRGSIVTLNKEGRVVRFVEKPKTAEAGLVGAVIYAFPQDTGRRITEYLGLGLPRDEPGRLIEWLHRQVPIYGYILDHDVWDIGTPAAYRMASEYLGLN